MPRIAFYGDDFTGSVDALLQYRRAGVNGVLVTSVDALRHAQGADVVGVAGIARSLPTEDLANEVRPVLEELRRLGPAIVQYKACSTADSSPTVGSLGRVIEIGHDVFGDAPVPVVFAQPDFGRYTVFGHHFARDGAHVYRLDRQPTMRHHPVTPATDSDLQVHLARQTRLPIGAVPWTAYADAGHLSSKINTGSDAAVICDSTSNDHLTLVAQAVLQDRRRPRFVLGSGGLSLGLGRALEPEPTPPSSSTVAPAAGPTIVVNGSMSPLTRAQIDHALQRGWVEVDLFIDDVQEVTASLGSTGTPVIITSHRRAAAPDPEDLAARMAAVADASLRRDPRTRLIVSGGDTSGRVLSYLGIESLTITHQPWDNVALCRAVGAAPHLSQVELVLKGGQMGHPSLFDDVRHGRALSRTNP